MKLCVCVCAQAHMCVYVHVALLGQVCIVCCGFLPTAAASGGTYEPAVILSMMWKR